MTPFFTWETAVRSPSRDAAASLSTHRASHCRKAREVALSLVGIVRPSTGVAIRLEAVEYRGTYV